MHKVDLTTLIKNFDGSPVKNEEAYREGMKMEDLPNLNLYDVLIKALGLMTKKDQDNPPSEDEKMWRWDMGQRLFKAKSGSIELTVEEMTRLQKRVGEVFITPIVPGNVNDIFNLLTDKKEKK